MEDWEWVDQSTEILQCSHSTLIGACAVKISDWADSMHQGLQLTFPLFLLFFSC